MGIEQGGEPREQNPYRTQRVRTAMQRRLGKETPEEYIDQSLAVRKVLDGQKVLPKNPLSSSAFLAYIEGRTNQHVPLDEGTLYYSKHLGNVGEETERVVAVPRVAIPPLVDKIGEACRFTDFQKNQWLTGATGDQIETMAKVIAESGEPLRRSSSEQELLHEVQLATGVTANTLDEITAARFADPTGEERLLSVPTNRPNLPMVIVPRYLEVQIKDDQDREPGAKIYRLGHIGKAVTYDDALVSFKTLIDYVKGENASTQITYPKQ